MSKGDFHKLGSTIVGLGHNVATTEQEILAIGLRLSGAGDLLGLTKAQLLGISTGLTTVGVNADACGTSFSRIFAEMDKAVQRRTGRVR